MQVKEEHILELAKEVTAKGSLNYANERIAKLIKEQPMLFIYIHELAETSTDYESMIKLALTMLHLLEMAKDPKTSVG
jgi:hypothetical protein